MQVRQTQKVISAFLAGIVIVLVAQAIGSLRRPGEAEAASAHMYAVYAISEDGQQLAPGIAGNILLNATGLQMALDDIAERGLRLHSVTCNGNVGGYVVICEQ